MLELNKATQRYAAIKAKIRAAKNMHAEQVHELQELSRTQQELERTLDQINKVRMENNDTMVRLHKEILEQKSKLERAARELKLARKTARSKVSSCVDSASGTFFTSFERQLKVREMEMRNNSVLQQLADMMDDIVGMAPVVTKQLFEKGLAVPQRSASGMAGVCGGGRSSNNTSVRSAASTLSEADMLTLPSMGDSASSSTASSRYGKNTKQKIFINEQLTTSFVLYPPSIASFVRMRNVCYVGSSFSGQRICWWAVCCDTRL